jgi:hypothetical protein
MGTFGEKKSENGYISLTDYKTTAKHLKCQEKQT